MTRRLHDDAYARRLRELDAEFREAVKCPVYREWMLWRARQLRDVCLFEERKADLTRLIEEMEAMDGTSVG